MAKKSAVVEYESDFRVKYEDFNGIFRDRGPNGWRLREVLRHGANFDCDDGDDVATLIWERDGAGIVDHALIQDPCEHGEFIQSTKLPAVWCCKACGEPMDKCLDQMKAPKSV